MRKIALVIGATLGICGTALAAAAVYDTGTYSGTTHQGLGIAMKVSSGRMDKMLYRANYRCADKQGNRATFSNVLNKLPAAPINGSQQVDQAYSLNGNTNSVHLFIAFNHGKAQGWFKQAFTTLHNGRTYLCVTPGGQATVAGKVFFAMQVS
jgi:hypothetical protein